jgi:F-type H+-transporting ATPase subunit epsilon
VAAARFDLSILTPERTVFEGSVEYVQVPGSEGYLGVLAGHAALVTALAPGVLTVRQPGGDEVRWRVSGGFFEVADGRATVLADEAVGDETQEPGLD